MNVPVLIYVAKSECPMCVIFNDQWTELKRRLNGKATFVKFLCSSIPKPIPIPPCLEPYGVWYPSIYLAGPNSYYRVFTHDDRLNPVDYRDDYVIKLKKFNSVTDDGVIVYAGKSNSADNIELWFNQVYKTVLELDEPTRPTYIR